MDQVSNTEALATERAKFEYERWLASGPHAPEIAADLDAIAGDSGAVFDRFYRDLAFGTGGLRGPLGAGTNRLNRYTVRRVTAGLCKYILNTDSQAAKRGVVIGYDCRHMSPEFALETALTLCAQGVRAYVFSHLCPTPELSFAVRWLGASAGVMLTASHNPPQDNGYKVYDHHGGQILPEVADKVIEQIRAAGDVLDIRCADQAEAESQGLLRFVGAEVDEAYEAAVLEAISVPAVGDAARAQLSVVYTPLHGTGNIPVQRVLTKAGFQSLHIVPTQELPDGDFPTVTSPNPEEPAALQAAVELARTVGADIVLGTDPDADRVGVAVRTRDGQYRLLSGNQVGGLLVDFWLRTLQDRGELPDNAVVFKTVVTSDLGAAVAAAYGVEVEDTLTGFKYIGARATDYEKSGESSFVFGYEESYGYLAAPIVRDKDAVQICLLIALMAAAYKQSGQTLVDTLEALYERLGYYQEALQSVTLPGAQGVRQMAALMERLRTQGVTVAGQRLVAIEDYLARTRTYMDGHTEPLAFPAADVVKYVFAGGSWLAVRPSGTEPKLKVYYGAKDTTEAACGELLAAMQSAVADILKRGV